MDPQMVGLVGGITGGVIGVIGGAVGTYFGVSNTRGPRERAFAVRMAVLIWAATACLLAALFLLPRPYSFLIWVPYSVGLPLAIRAMNRRQGELRRADEAEQV